MRPNPNGNSQLRYIRVANELRRKVMAGEYQPGERLPTQHNLAKEHNVAFTTLKQALDILEAEGYLVRRVGQGTFAALPEEQTPTALVVDDEENIRVLFSRTLENSGWKCVTVASGQAALAAWEETPFDLIFLDLVMAGMNGAETLQHIRKIAPEVPVIIVTAYPDSDLMAQALNTGPIGVMRKPISLAELRVLLDTEAGRLAPR